MTSKTLLAAIAFASAVAALPAAAQDTGLYVGAGLGVAKGKQICANTATCDDTESPVKLFGGYKLHRNLAVEGGYQYFGTFSQGPRGIVSNAIDIVAVGSWPVMQELALYGKAGGYFARTSSAPASEDNSGLTYGFGAEWALDKAWSVRGEWQRYNNVGGSTLLTTDIDVFGAFIVWRPRF